MKQVLPLFLPNALPCYTSQIPKTSISARRMGFDNKEKAERFLDNLQESCKTVRNTYISYLLVAVYIGITAAGVTHEQLLNPDLRLSLPVIGVALPLVGFFFFAPTLLFLFQLYFLLHAAHNAREMNEAYEFFKNADMEEKDWKPLVHGSMFTLYFLEPVTVLPSNWKWMNRIVYFSFYYPAPIITAIIWWQFLPYQNLGITVFHIILTCCSLGASFDYFVQIDALKSKGEFSSFLDGFKNWLKENLLAGKKWLLRSALYFTIAIVVSIQLLALFNLVAPSLLDYPCVEYEIFDPPKCVWLTLELHEKKLALAPSDVIKAAYKDDPEGLLKHYKRLDLKYRNLRFADLSGSDLVRADLTGAKLRFANLSSADLRDAKLSRADLQDAKLLVAHLQGADLSFADLQGADLLGTHLQGADLSLARLQGAKLSHADLQGADLRFARLQGADLRFAHLQGAKLLVARLQGANLSDTNIDGADFTGAELTALSVDEIAAVAETIPEMTEKIGPKKLDFLERMELTGGETVINLSYGPVRIRHSGQEQFAGYPSLPVADIEKVREEIRKRIAAEEKTKIRR